MVFGFSVAFFEKIFRSPLYRFSVIYRLPKDNSISDELNWIEFFLFKERVLNLNELCKELDEFDEFDGFERNAIKQEIRIYDDACFEIPEQHESVPGLEIIMRISGEEKAMRLLSKTLMKCGVKEGQRFTSEMGQAKRDYFEKNKQNGKIGD